MLRHLNIITFLLIPVISTAQSPRADSIRRAMEAMRVTGDAAQLQARADAAYALGVELHRQKAYEQSREFYRQALPFYLKKQEPKPIANTFSAIGFSYQFQGRFPEALDTFLLGLKYYELARDTGKMAQTATSLSNIYGEMPEQRDKALQYARFCMDITAQARRLHGLCACTHLTGTIYTQAGQLDSAEFYIRKSLLLLETKPDLPGLVTVYLALARLEEKRRQFDLELQWLQKALQTQQQYPDGVSSYEQANLFLAFANAGLNRQQPREVMTWLTKVTPLMPEIQDITYYERFYESNSRLAEMENRPADALRFYKLQMAARDSSRNEDNTRRMTQIQMNHDFEKKEAALTAQQQQELALRDARTRQQQLLFSLLLLVVAGGGGFGFFYYRQQQQRRRTELELANLRAQINPHFIFNCLNSIYRYTKERDTETAGIYLQKFSSLLRLVLDNSRKEKITLAKDLETLQLYVDIESLRFKNKLQYQLEIDPEIDPTFTEIPGMLLQPHVENAIWHGLMPKSTGGQITVRIRQAGEILLHVEIEDDGVGRAVSAARSPYPASRSLGQKITDERLKAAGKLAKSEIVDLFSDQGNAAGTRVVLQIPL